MYETFIYIYALHLLRISSRFLKLWMTFLFRHYSISFKLQDIHFWHLLKYFRKQVFVSAQSVHIRFPCPKSYDTFKIAFHTKYFQIVQQMESHGTVGGAWQLLKNEMTHEIHFFSSKTHVRQQFKSDELLYIFSCSIWTASLRFKSF